MTTLESLAAAMFPAITHTPEDYEAMYLSLIHIFQQPLSFQTW